MADTPDPQELARRYLDLWQQHLTQAATDTDLAATMANLAQFIPGGAAANVPGWPPAPGSPVTSGDAAAQGPASDAAASDGRSDGFDQLDRRLESLEKRLDALERASGSGGKRLTKGSGKRRS